jgi:hypothetical protein
VEVLSGLLTYRGPIVVLHSVQRTTKSHVAPTIPKSKLDQHLAKCYIKTRIPLWCCNNQQDRSGQQQALLSSILSADNCRGNVPSAFLKEAVWQVINGVEHYYAKSHTPEESGLSNWYPVEFNFEQVCWVEVCWVEPVAGEGYWQAFCIAGEDLHLDISTAELAEQDHIEAEQ